jgi:hypothetical protein
MNVSEKSLSRDAKRAEQDRMAWREKRTQAVRWKQLAEGVAYDEEVAGAKGMSFVLLPESLHSDDDIQRAADYLRDQRDVVSLQYLRLEPSTWKEMIMKSEAQWLKLLRHECGLNSTDSQALSADLCDLAAKHLTLCELDLNPGLTDEQRRAQDGIEAAIRDRIKSVRGIKGVSFIDDPRGETVGIKFESGNCNSFQDGGQCWKVPVFPNNYKSLDADFFWREYVTAPDIFGYYVNLDERGGFFADVRDVQGKTVVEIKTGNALDDGEEESMIVEDGFMKHKADIDGLTEYLRSVGAIGAESEVLEMQEFEARVSAWKELREPETYESPSP